MLDDLERIYKEGIQLRLSVLCFINIFPLCPTGFIILQSILEEMEDLQQLGHVSEALDPMATLTPNSLDDAAVIAEHVDTGTIVPMPTEEDVTLSSEIQADDQSSADEPIDPYHAFTQGDDFQPHHGTELDSNPESCQIGVTKAFGLPDETAPGKLDSTIHSREEHLHNSASRTSTNSFQSGSPCPSLAAQLPMASSHALSIGEPVINDIALPEPCSSSPASSDSARHSRIVSSPCSPASPSSSSYPDTPPPGRVFARVSSPEHTDLPIFTESSPPPISPSSSVTPGEGAAPLETDTSSVITVRFKHEALGSCDYEWKRHKPLRKIMTHVCKEFKLFLPSCRFLSDDGTAVHGHTTIQSVSLLLQCGI